MWKWTNRMNGKLTIVLVHDVMTCYTAHGVTTIMKSKEIHIFYNKGEINFRSIILLFSDVV